jgi:lipoprotein-anchoring transpeptidase ErfK/SrfK
MERILRFVALTALLGAATACGADREVERRAERPPPPPPRPAVTEPAPPVDTGPRCRPGSFEPLGSARVAYAAVVRTSASAFRSPGRGLLARFGRLNVNGVPTVFGVRGAIVGRRCRPTWYRVQLPLRPNGVTGYVRARDVQLARVRTRIVVDLSDRRVTLFRDGRRTIQTTAAIGSSATPTPVGRFYVNQRLIPHDTTGPFGPGAIGISAFSDVLTGWAQGGPIAIHGTNQPWSIGQAVSNGCIRVRNPVLRRLFSTALAGTPVFIRR